MKEIVIKKYNNEKNNNISYYYYGICTQNNYDKENSIIWYAENMAMTMMPTNIFQNKVANRYHIYRFIINEKEYWYAFSNKIKDKE